LVIGHDDDHNSRRVGSDYKLHSRQKNENKAYSKSAKKIDKNVE